VEISVAPLGYVVIPLGVLLFFKSRRQLFWATVASIPFFYTYVVDLSVTLVQPYQYFGVLLILRNVLDLALGRDRRPWTISRTAAAAFLFLLVAYLSLFMPAVLRDTIYVLPMDTPYQEYENVEPLRFSIANVFQVAYPTFMVLMSLCLAREIRDLETLKNVVRVNVAACFAVIGFGLFHQIGMMLGLDPVVESAFRVVTGFSEVPRIYSTYNMIGPLPRMFSLAGEPGYTGSYLIFVFAIVLGLGYNVVGGGWRLKRRRLLELGLLFGLIMTGSTTSYLGLVVLMLVLVALPKVFQLGERGSRHRSALKFTTFFVVTAVLVLLAAPIVLETSYVDYVYETHYAKLFLQEGSGSVRSITVRSGVEVFLQSPLLGVGYGSHRTSSLLTSLLSNVGLAGTLAFLWFNAVVFRRGLRACRRSSNPGLTSMAYALLVGLGTLLPVMLIAKSMIALIHGWYWLLVAMLEGIYRVYRLEASATADERSPVPDGCPAAAPGTS
jgi:hypothetical protein